MPAVKVVVLKEAVVAPPVVLTPTGLPALLPSTWNCTVPVGEPAPGAVILMMAVKVTFCPEIEGATEDSTAVLVLAFVTVLVMAVEMLAAKIVSPP